VGVRDAIEAVMMPEPWRIPMRRLSPLLALLLVTPALADTLDCAVMRGSNRSEQWYSRDLKTSLYSRTENSRGAIVEIRARDISTSFTPVE
jgi:hypothetical protein